MKCEPTNQQCENSEEIYEDDKRVAYACWYHPKAGVRYRATLFFDKLIEPNSGIEFGLSDSVLYAWVNGVSILVDENNPGEFVVFN